MTDPAKPIDDLAEALEELLTILIVKEDVLPGVSTTGDMVYSTFEFDPQRTRHARKVLQLGARYKV